jgi:crossover junction endodeoxyribonuclease RuvC
MRILGIDPGSYNCGYGLIECRTLPRGARRASPAHVYLSSGRVVLPAKMPLHERLKELYTGLVEMLEEYRPDEIIIERMFFAKSVRAALSLGHARGVVLIAAALTNLPIYEYSALEVKKAVVGYGRADKNQVQYMVREILKIDRALSPDSADALALALCHAHTKQFGMQTDGRVDR